ncbi:MAG TPA: 4Fe-4S double cluster binding domain-containing protein [candidate division Zixibacteria bacterium]|nr:4Fe-4S double cluster binding domain-containing protein [candidate division Zixibacteria bacterium]
MPNDTNNLIDCYTIEDNNYFYKYGILSIKYLETMKEDVAKLKREKKLSDYENFQRSMQRRDMEKPSDFPEAKYLIIVARARKLAFINFHYNDKKYEITVPPDFHDDGVTNEDVEKLLQKHVIKKPGYKLVETEKIHLKLAAVRSGLAKYGRNNISYVDGMGSFLTLSAYYTDYDFQEETIHELSMMDRCKNCTICINNCPTKAISKDRFVIDAGKCITMYNEHPGEFPSWLDKHFHNAIEGCLHCQRHCPANREVIKNTVKLEDITEAETKVLLDNLDNPELLNSLIKKLKMFTLENASEELPIVRRNLEVLIR